MDRFRTFAALGNGALVLGLYMRAWGAPVPEVAALELTLAMAATWSTWYALRRLSHR
jgi:hypothetical protein